MKQNFKLQNYYSDGVDVINIADPGRQSGELTQILREIAQQVMIANRQAEEIQNVLCGPLVKEPEQSQNPPLGIVGQARFLLELIMGLNERLAYINEKI